MWRDSVPRARRERAPKIAHVHRPTALAGCTRRRRGPGARDLPEFDASSVRNRRNGVSGAVRGLDVRHGLPLAAALRAAGTPGGVEVPCIFVNRPYRGCEGAGRRPGGPCADFGVGIWRRCWPPAVVGCSSLAGVGGSFGGLFRFLRTGYACGYGRIAVVVAPMEPEVNVCVPPFL